MAAITLTFTNAGLNFLRDSLPGQNNANGRITYFAVGTGTTAPSVTDTKLANEVYRAVFQSVGAGGTGEEHMYGFVDLAFANGSTLSEAAIFGGPTVTSTANTGIMIARALLSPTISKTNGLSVTLDFDITF